MPAAPFRPLTPGERALAQSVFGASIDYDRVRITEGRFFRFQPKGTAMAPNGHLYMHGCYRDDYSTENASRRAHFIHEMTHVWQYQNKVLNPILSAVELSLKFKFNYNASYDYTLDAGKDLIAYNMEQQASIVQDYYLMTQGDSRHQGRCRNKCTAEERRALYEKVLANFLNDPGYVRAKPGTPPPSLSS